MNPAASCEEFFRLNQNFTVSRLNEVWVSDITYIKTSKGWLYLTTIVDLYDRQVIDWSLSTRLYTNQTIIPAWKMAINKRQITEDLEVYNTLQRSLETY